MKIEFGLKLWSINYILLGEAAKLIEKDIIQYIELMPVPNTDISPFLEVDVPYVIHITTEEYGVNIANKNKEEFNMETIDMCIEWADSLEARCLILHPGYGLINNAIEFLKKIKDKRISIENMPKVGMNNEKMVGYAVEQVAELMNNRFGFCLDFGHAIKAAVSLNYDYKKYIKGFLKLNPTMFHISDGKLNNEKDEHLHIGKGDYDFEFLMSCIKKNEFKYVTLETPGILATFDEDLKNLEKFMP